MDAGESLEWSLGAVNQDDLEKDLLDKANADLAERENELDQRRLEKTLKKRSELTSQLSALKRKVDDPRTLISQKERIRANIEHVESELAQLSRDESDITGRIDSRKKTSQPNVKQETDESRHDYLVRTGKITPFAKIDSVNGTYEHENGTEDSTLNEKDDHRSLKKPAALQIDADEADEDYTEDTDFTGKAMAAKLDTKVRDDGILRDYQYRIRNWEKVRESRRNELPKDVIIDKEAGFKVPGDIWNQLFGYQRTGVRWLWELYSQKIGGIIGDEMGLGKTVQVAAFLASLHYSNLLTKPALIVCPATVLDQWLDELHQWWPPLRVAILHSIGSAMGNSKPAERSDFDDFSDEGSDEDSGSSTTLRQGAAYLVNSIFKTGHVIITTYAGIKIYEKYLIPRVWGYCCLDEGHKIRNPDSEVSLACKQVKTPYRLILSGTPIQNNLTELWSLFDFIYPGRLGTLPVFQAQFSVPINVGGYANATNIQVQTAYKCAVVLRDMIAPYMLRRMKSDVASDLPAKTEKVLFCKLTKYQKQSYLEFLRSDECGSIMKGKRQVLFGVDILRKICNHPDLILRDTKKRDYGDPLKSGKMQVVGALLKLWKNQKHRALLFSQTRQMLDILESYVNDLDLKYLRMDGATQISRRQQLVDTFNNDESYQVFLLTTKVGGLGVNLTGANRVIIYDPDWNPSTDVQARERAWRLGQKKEVMIYRLMIAGSIEEKIYQRQIFKHFLTNKILKDPKQKRFFKNTDLHDLFTLGDSSESTILFNGSNTKPPSGGNRTLESKRRKLTPTGQNDTEDDLQNLAGISKEDDYRISEEGDQKDGNKHEENSILEGIFAKAGVQSTLEHDAVINVSRPDTVLMEREAERVASQAAAALRESRTEARKAKIGTPTWTGKFGIAGKLQSKKGTQKNGGGSTSAKILQSLRHKKELESKAKSSQMLGSGQLSRYASTLQSIRNFLDSQPDKQASSADIVSACKLSLDGPQEVSNLRHMLRKVATWEGKKWKLLDEEAET